MPAARNFGLLVLKKQATAGVAETTTTGGYGMPIISGGLGPQKEFGDLPRGGSSMTRLGRFAQRATLQGTVTLMAHPDALGLLLYNAMGAELAVGTSGAKTKHTFVMADAWPSPLTIWERRASGSDGDMWRFRDSYVSKLTIMGTSGENVAVTVDFVSKHYTKPSVQTIPAGYVLDTASPRFKYIGSVVRLDSDSAVPTIMDNVESVTFEVDRTPEIRYGATLTPAVFAPDRLVNFNANVSYDTGAGGTGATAFDRRGWEFIQNAYLSALDGDPDQGTPTGSFDVRFGRHPADADGYLEIFSGGGAGLPTVVAIQQNWDYQTSRPEASGTPALLSYDLNGILEAPAAGTTEATVVLANDVATLYSA